MSKESDRAFMKRFGVVLGLLVGSAIVLVVISWLISLQEPKLQDFHQKQVAARIQPAGQVATADSSGTSASSAPAATGSAPAASGEASASTTASASAAAPAAAPGGEETASAAPAKSGHEVVTQLCASCHATGVLGAPKIGDTADWKARLKKAGGLDGLVKTAISGIGNMPPKGGNPDLSDAEVKAAVKDLLKTANVSQ